MAAFIRRFNFDPGEDVLLEIESVNILDLDPPANLSGVGSGTVLMVGEFENGAYKTPTEVASGTDMTNVFGTFGYSYNGTSAQNPCARARKADNAILTEYWNGNGAVQLSGKKFNRLVLCRVDTSVGEVTFNRKAYVKGLAAFTYNLEPAQVLQLDVGTGPTSATFTAAAAVYNSGSGVFPTTFVGGETLTMAYDDKDPITVTFQVTDTSKLLAIARINAAFGFTFAADGGGNITTFTSIRRGAAAKVRVIAASALVLTALNIVVGTTLGTGNVGDIDAVKFGELKTIIETGITGSQVEQDSGGALRLSAAYAAAGDYISVGGASTAASALGLTIGQYGSNDGIARIRSTAGTFNLAGNGNITVGYDDAVDVTVALTTGDSQAVVITKINTAVGYTMASSVSATITKLQGKKNGGNVRITAGTPATLTALGFTLNTSVTAATVLSGKIPAGTQITNAANTNVFVTARDVAVKSTVVGPYTARVRHALDDGTGVGATAGTLTTVVNAPDLGAFACTNNANVSAAFTEAALDAAYVDAINATLDLNTVAREVNIIYAARQSNAIRRQLRANANDASASGLLGRIAVIRPPMGTLKTDAKSTVAEPGVGAYRSQRVVYTYPNACTFVPLIARLGVTGGAGFTADGIVDVGADGFLASVCSQLPPEENPGQQTTFTDGVVGLESSVNVDGFVIGDYTAFKASGICALRIDEGVAVFQSGVTSVDPLTQPQLKNIARRRMADYIQDSLARAMKKYSKKLNMSLRRTLIATEIRTFMSGLLSVGDPTRQRIFGYTVDARRGNNTTSLQKGLYRIIVNARTLASLDSITLATSIGESVEVDEVFPEAA